MCCFSPVRAFTSVLLPTFGLPLTAASGACSGAARFTRAIGAHLLCEDKAGVTGAQRDHRPADQIGCLLYTSYVNVPEDIQGDVVDFDLSDESGAAVTSDGRVHTWGNNVHNTLTVPEEIQGNVVSVSGGRYHFTAILDDGSVALSLIHIWAVITATGLRTMSWTL